MNNKYFWLSVITAALLLSVTAGCDRGSSSGEPFPQTGAQQTATADAKPVDASEAEAQPFPQVGAQEIPLHIMSWDEAQELVADKQGKVVVLDIWSTWCVPCKREFPHLVELHNTRGDRVACISVNINYDGLESEPPESFREEVMEFLARQGADFDNVICSDPASTIYDRLKLSSIPAVMVYDQQGELVKRFDNDQKEYGDSGFTYQDNIVPLVEELLATQS